MGSFWWWWWWWWRRRSRAVVVACAREENCVINAFALKSHTFFQIRQKTERG